ncbi:MAG: hypothetical protein HGA81_09570 [Chlorobium limicola]|nr:hypothetical protein [Chlorobium limicola]
MPHAILISLPSLASSSNVMRDTLRDLPVHRRMALDHECLNELKFHGLSG